MTTTLRLEDLRGRSFLVGAAVVPEWGRAARTPPCSAMDLCPTRPC